MACLRLEDAGREECSCLTVACSRLQDLSHVGEIPGEPVDGPRRPVFDVVEGEVLYSLVVVGSAAATAPTADASPADPAGGLWSPPGTRIRVYDRSDPETYEDDDRTWRSKPRQRERMRCLGRRPTTGQPARLRSAQKMPRSPPTTFIRPAPLDEAPPRSPTAGFLRSAGILSSLESGRDIHALAFRAAGA